MPPPLPPTLGRFGRLAPMPNDDTRTVAVDTVTDREAELVRVPFGAARRADRDAFVGQLRERTTLVHPALRAVLDGGEWDDDAFAALELLRGETPLSEWAPTADHAARARAAAELGAGAAVLFTRHLGLGSDPEVVVDDYGQPKVLGIEHATDQAAKGAALTQLAIVERAASVAPEPFGERLRAARTQDARQAVFDELERQSHEQRRPLTPGAAVEARALGRASGSRNMLIGLAVLAFFAVLVGAGLVILR